jgi:hypothetical protein
MPIGSRVKSLAVFRVVFFVVFRVGVFLGFWLKTGELSAVIVSGYSGGSRLVRGLYGFLGVARFFGRVGI